MTPTAEAGSGTRKSECTISDDDWNMWSQVLRDAALKVRGSKPMTRESLQREMNEGHRVDIYGHCGLELIESCHNVAMFVRDTTHKKLVILSWRIRVTSHDRAQAGVFIATRTSIEHYEQSSSPNRSMWMRARNNPDTRFAADQLTPVLLACVPEDDILSPFEHALQVKKRDAEIEQLRERLIRSEMEIDKKKASLGAAEKKIQGLERAARARAQRARTVRVTKMEKGPEKSPASVEKPLERVQIDLVQNMMREMKRIWEVNTPDEDDKMEVDERDTTDKRRLFTDQHRARGDEQQYYGAQRIGNEEEVIGTGDEGITSYQPQSNSASVTHRDVLAEDQEKQRMVDIENSGVVSPVVEDGEVKAAVPDKGSGTEKKATAVDVFDTYDESKLNKRIDSNSADANEQPVLEAGERVHETLAVERPEVAVNEGETEAIEPRKMAEHGRITPDRDGTKAPNTRGKDVLAKEDAHSFSETRVEGTIEDVATLYDTAKQHEAATTDQDAGDKAAPETITGNTSDTLFHKLLQVIEEHKNMEDGHYEKLERESDGGKKRKFYLGPSDEESERLSHLCGSLPPFKKRRCSSCL